MRLPNPPPTYRPVHEHERSRQIEAADKRNHKRGADIEVAPGRLILTAPNGTRYVVSVTNAGALSVDGL